MDNAIKTRWAWIFAGALLLQGAHQIEHFTQIYQYVILRRPIFDAHGVLFFFDLEWNHFTFNFLYFILLGFVFIGYRFFDLSQFRNKIPHYLFLLGFFIQGYHVLEHTARIGQTLQSGCEPCPGILGWYFNGIYLHFTLNSTVLLLPAISFFAYGVHRNLFPSRNV